MKMDSTGCPNLYATDRLMTFLPSSLNDPNHLCAANLPLYWVFAMLICSLRIGTALFFTKLWLEDVRKTRQRQAQGRGQGYKFTGLTRIPFVPVLACVSAMALCLGFVLGGLNVTNRANMGAPVLFSIAVICEVLLALLYLKKLIGVSTSILRWLKVKGSNDHLNKPDVVLKVLIATCIVLVVAQVSTLCTPPSYISAATGCLAAIALLFSFGFGWQFQRLIWQLQATGTPESAAFVKLTVWKMRAQQLAGGLIGIPVFIVYLLITIEYIDLSYGVLLFTLGFYRVLELLFVFTRRKRGSKTSKQVEGVAPIDNAKTASTLTGGSGGNRGTNKPVAESPTTAGSSYILSSPGGDV